MADSPGDSNKLWEKVRKVFLEPFMEGIASGIANLIPGAKSTKSPADDPADPPSEDTVKNVDPASHLKGIDPPAKAEDVDPPPFSLSEKERVNDEKIDDSQRRQSITTETSSITLYRRYKIEMERKTTQLSKEIQNIMQQESKDTVKLDQTGDKTKKEGPSSH